MPRNLIIAVVLVLILPGCASHPFNGDKGKPYIHPGEDRVWHPLPRSGTRITILDNASGVEREVTVMESYRAASGRTCTLYTRSDANQGNASTGLACRNGDRWVDVPFITNPDSRRPANS